MANTTQPTDEERAAARHYLLRFEVDTFRSRPLWIRLIIEFIGTFILVTVATGAGVINHCWPGWTRRDLPDLPDRPVVAGLGAGLP
jgi:glycerol uptake facilitator-like aquaporin